MQEFKIKTLHDVIVTLRDIVHFLEVFESRMSTVPVKESVRAKKVKDNKKTAIDIISFSEKIRYLPRQELIETLKPLSATTLRSLCYQLGLKGMSKQNKEKMIEIIVREFIDFPTEHKRLRTFSQSNG